MSLDNGAAKNGETRSKHQNNAGKVTEFEKSKATNAVIGSCNDDNDRGRMMLLEMKGEAEAMLT